VEMVTEAYFQQRNFSNTDLVRSLFAGLSQTLSTAIDVDALFLGICPPSLLYCEYDLMDYVSRYKKTKRTNYLLLGTSPRFLIHQFKKKALTLIKLLLLERRVIFYGLPVGELSVLLLTLVSLFPGLLPTLKIGDEKGQASVYVTTQLDKIQGMEREFVSPPPRRNSGFSESQRQRSRREAWENIGLPLRIFEKGSVFLPYFSLLQLGELTADGVRSYTVGCSNAVLPQQRQIRPEVFVNVQEGTITFLGPQDALRRALYLSNADYEFISKIVEVVEPTWHPEGLPPVQPPPCFQCYFFIFSMQSSRPALPNLRRGREAMGGSGSSWRCT